MCVGLWLEKQQWSVAYLLRDPFDYVNSKRKFGLIPNDYVRVTEQWTSAELKK
jgi:hypothetical protein